MKAATISARLAVLCGMLAMAAAVEAQPADRIRFNGQDLFLSGGNVAWVDFARDIGPGATKLATFDQIFADLHEHGGNAMRLWLHTTGDVTPAYSAAEIGAITGPGDGTIEDLRSILDTAWKHEVGLILCLWSFDMLQTGRSATKFAQNKALLQSADLTQTYIDNALTPMVQALAGHPALIAWEIFNEPEGMTTQFGWTPQRVGMTDVQRFVNQTAGAIHDADPNALVTNGSWSFRAHSDVLNGQFEKNYYDDDELVAVGGVENGTLDFFTVHYYEWGGTRLSPFHHDYSYWGLDKPLVVAEFFMGTGADDGNTGATFGVGYQDLFETLYDRGYAGALAWQWFNYPSGAEGVVNWPRMLENTETLFAEHREAVDVIRGFGVTYFKATPERIAPGDSSVLAWDVSRATSVMIDGTPVDTIGTRTVRPAETTTYTLTASGPDTTATRTVTIEVLSPEETNRAQGRPVVASSSEAGLGSGDPSRAVDGDVNTRWSSEWQAGAVTPDDEWIYVDLGKTYDIARVVLRWEAAHGTEYDIDVSADAASWTTVHAERAGDGGTDEIAFGTPVSGRFVRMHGLKRATQWGFSLWEFEVYGMPGATSFFELEDAAFTGEVTVVTNDPSASGGSYLDMRNTGTITLENVTAPADGSYTLSIGYQTPFGPKKQYLDVNGVRITEMEFGGPFQTWQTTNVVVPLVAGANRIEIVKSWGWMNFDYLEVTPGSVGVEDGETPGRNALYQNYPNPFNPVTTIEYHLPQASHVRLDVFDAAGRRVAVLADGLLPQGDHIATFDATDLATGVYFYRLQVNGKVESRPMVLLR